MSDISTKFGKSITALIVMVAVFVCGLFWSLSAPLHPVEPGVVWNVGSGEPPPRDFRVVEFPTDFSTSMTASDGAAVGMLDRALVDTLEELTQDRVKVQNVSGDTWWQRRADLCLTTDAQRMDALIANWHRALEARRPDTQGDRTWITHKLTDGGGKAFEIQTADGEETFRWRYEVRDSNVVPIEFAWKSKRDDYVKGGGAVSTRLTVVCIGAPILGVASYRWPRSRRGKRQ